MPSLIGFYAACFLLIISVGFPPLLLVSIPLVIISGRALGRRIKAAREADRAARQAIARRAYYADLRRRANGEL